jgi:hypothetical protein
MNMNTMSRKESRSLLASRRRLLRAAGVGLALPFLEATAPQCRRAIASEDAGPPRRMLAICNNLGLLSEHFFPKTAGPDYEPSPYLEILARHRRDFTVFSGVWHPDVDGGHPADNCFLTAAPHPSGAGFRNTISLDQHVAERIGPRTRFPSLTLGVNETYGQRSLSWTGAGVLIPCEDKASAVYRQLFLQGSPAEIEQQVRKLRMGESIMDTVGDQARRLEGRLGARDRQRLDQYLTGVRELERRLASSRDWEYRPKPSVAVAEPHDPADPRAYMEKVRLMYDMARLAFETDSTRVVTLLLDSVSSPAIEVEGATITDGYHNLSHHGRDPGKLAQLRAIDEWHMRLLGGLFDGLKSVSEQGETLLDRTMVLYGSNLGNANTHVTTNLPVLLAGGGFRHGQHLEFDADRNYPLPNLFVSMLERLGLEDDRFASSTGSMRGLEPV